MAIVNAAVLLLACSGLIVFNQNSLGRIMESENSGALAVGAMGYMFLYILMLAVLYIGTTIFFYIRFYRNLYTDQGYLMHTLPVSSNELLLSKLFVAFIWRAISTIVCTIAISAIVVGMMGPDYRKDFVDEMKDFFRETTMSDAQSIVFIIVMITLAIGSALFTILMGYAAISIGQQFARNKVIASVGIYLGIRFLINIISNIISQGFFFSRAFDNAQYYDSDNAAQAFLLILIVIDLLIIAGCIAFYFISNQFMDKKLNLD